VGASLQLGGARVMRFSGKVALVTGSSQGIGRAVALRFAAEGARVAINYRSGRERAEAVVGEASRLGGGAEAFAVQADVGDPVAVRDMFRAVADRFGGALDFLVFNAAATTFRPLLEQKERNIDRTFGLTVRGFLLAVQEAVPLMEGRRGRIVTISGIDSLRALSGHGLLGSAKAALETLTMYLARELGPRGISVNGINPGLVETESSKLYAGGEEGWARYVRDVVPDTPAGRLGRPEDMAAVAAFLCSEDADFIRGQTLLVDGGLLSASVASRPHD